MSGSLARVVRVAVTEWTTALRSRRALVVTLLFVAVSGLVMYGTISVFAALEREVVTALRLPASETAGAVSMALWKSPIFVRIMDHFAGDGLVFADIRGRHPVLLAYAMFIFQVVPLLTLLVSASRVADDVRSGSARYWLLRVTRAEWSLGKFFGEALMIAAAMAVGTLTAWGVVLGRLSAADGLRMLPGIADWTVRAWVYAFAWLGLFLGLSHIVKSGGRATALGILALLGAAAWSPMLANVANGVPGFGWAAHLDGLVPNAAWTLLWRRTPSVLVQGVVHLGALAFLYLGLGEAVFLGRDV